jgi:hypothetical protein
MRGLRKRVQGFVERPSSEILLRLRVILIAPRVDLVTASGEQRRGKEFRSGTQQTGREIDRRGRGEVQLARGRFVGVRKPGLRIGARDVLRIRFPRDGRGMSGSVHFLLCTLTFPFVLGIPRTTGTSIPRCSRVDLG